MKKVCVIAALLLMAGVTVSGSGSITYQDIADEFINAQKETVYNLDLNAPYSKDKSGVREVIDPETGDLNIICDLFSLKGRAGVNSINLSLSYRNSASKAKEENAEYIDGVYRNVLAEKTDFQKSISYFGTGWSLYFPYVEKQDEYNKTNLYVHLADGTVYRHDKSANGLENHDLENVYFSETDMARSGAVCKYMLEYADGTRYYFDESGYLAEKTDRYNNTVRYIWTTRDEVKVIQYISDNCGQTVEFIYETDAAFVRFENQSYRLQRKANKDGIGELVSITDPAGRTTGFEYYRADLEYTFFNKNTKTDPITNPYYLIRRVNYPLGTQTVYEYVRGRKWLYEKEDGYLDYVRLAKRYDTDQKSISDLMSYVYFNEPDGYPKYKPEKLPREYFYSTSEMDKNGDGTAYNYDSRHYQFKTEIWADGRCVSEEIKEFDPMTGMPKLFIGNTYNKKGDKRTVYNSTKFDRRGNISEQAEYSENEDPKIRLHTYRRSDKFNICIYESYYRDADTFIELKRSLNPAGSNIAEETTFSNGRKIKQDSFAYDSCGNITLSKVQTDKDSFLITQYEYDSRQRFPSKITLKDIKDADGTGTSYSTEYEYDRYGNIIRQKDNNGYIIRYEYDILNRLTKEILEDGKAREYKYNDKENKINTTDAAGARLLYEYDGYGRLAFVTDEISDTTLTARQYDEKNRLIKETDANNNSQYYFYDGLGRYVRTEIKDADGKVISRRTADYDEVYPAPEGKALKMRVSDGAGFDIRSTEYLFDYKNRLIKKSLLSKDNSRTELFTYDLSDNNLSRTDSAGRITKMDYDCFGNCIRIIKPDGSEENFEYNFIGNQTKSTNGMGESISAEYDSLGRLIKKEIPGGEETSVFKIYYDYRGNIIRKTDAKGFKTDYEYDCRGMNAKEKQFSSASEGTETIFEYDGEGRLAKSAYGAIGKENERHIYKNVLDHMGRITKSIDNMNNISYTEYDGNGNIIRKTDPNGIVTEFKYNALNQVTAESNSKNGTKVFEYNDFGELIRAADSQNEITYSYNSFGELIKVKDLYSEESFSYDIKGNMLEYKKNDKAAGDISQSRRYDALDRLSEVITPLGTELISYDKAGRIISKTNTGSGTEKSYAYNPNGTVRNIRTIQNGEKIFEENYKYDKNLNRVYADENGDVTEYIYDGMNRLKEYSVNKTKSVTYEFDGYNNISKEYEILGDTVNTKFYQYDPNNRLILKSDGNQTTQYNYDNNGNLTEKTTGTGSDILKEFYSYDGYNRLTDYISNTTAAQYSYDISGMRKTKTVNGEITRFIYNGGDIIGEITPEKIYKYYRGTELIGSTCGTEQYYYQTNAHGDIYQISDYAGNEIKSNKFDPYGNKENLSINPEGNNTILYQWKKEIDNTHTPFGYCGEYQDEETGLIYLRNRYYDPSVARFITEDPVRDGLNWYGRV